MLFFVYIPGKATGAISSVKDNPKKVWEMLHNLPHRHHGNAIGACSSCVNLHWYVTSFPGCCWWFLLVSAPAYGTVKSPINFGTKWTSCPVGLKSSQPSTWFWSQCTFAGNKAQCLPSSIDRSPTWSLCWPSRGADPCPLPSVAIGSPQKPGSFAFSSAVWGASGLRASPCVGALDVTQPLQHMSSRVSLSFNPPVAGTLRHPWVPGYGVCFSQLLDSFDSARLLDKLYPEYFIGESKMR